MGLQVARASSRPQRSGGESRHDSSYVRLRGGQPPLRDPDGSLRLLLSSKGAVARVSADTRIEAIASVLVARRTSLDRLISLDVCKRACLCARR